MNLKNFIRSIPDYPKRGILFRDITTLIKDEKAFKETIDQNLYERTIFSPVPLNEAREILSKLHFTNYLQSRDVRGYKRFPTNWSPGSGKDIPKLNKITHNLSSSFKTDNYEYNELYLIFIKKIKDCNWSINRKF